MDFGFGDEQMDVLGHQEAAEKSSFVKGTGSPVP
jgi:hypothetical protein